MKAVTDPERCKACGLCLVNCPKQAIAGTDILNHSGYKVVAVEEKKCVGCGICYTVCPDGVFSILEEGGDATCGT